MQSPRRNSMYSLHNFAPPTELCNLSEGVPLCECALYCGVVVSSKLALLTSLILKDMMRDIIW